MPKIKELRKLLNQMPPTTYLNVLGRNSKVMYSRGEYRVYAGGINPKFKGSFEYVRDCIQQELTIWHSGLPII